MPATTVGCILSGMTTFPPRLTAAREKRGLNQSELARRIGVTPQSVQAWESGKSTPRDPKMKKLALELNVPASYLRGETDEHPSGLEKASVRMGSIETWDDSTPLGDDEVYVPLLREVELAAGSGRFVIEEVNTGRLRFFKSDLRRNDVQFSNAKCVVVSGNSMDPVLRHGAVVGVNVGKNSISDVTDSEMYALSHCGQLRIKQLYRTPTGIRMRSFNREEYPDEDYSFQEIEQQQISILGHVFWWGMFSR